MKVMTMKKDEPMLQVAAKAILVTPSGKILIMREAGESYAEGTNEGKYHAAAGGRINPSETFAEGLQREVAEETGISEFEALYPVYVGEWWPEIKGSKRHIVSVFMLCTTKQSKIILSEEHDDHKWISPDEADEYDLLESDREAIKAYLKLRSII